MNILPKKKTIFVNGYVLFSQITSLLKLLASPFASLVSGIRLFPFKCETCSCCLRWAVGLWQSFEASETIGFVVGLVVVLIKFASVDGGSVPANPDHNVLEIASEAVVFV